MNYDVRKIMAEILSDSSVFFIIYLSKAFVFVAKLSLLSLNWFFFSPNFSSVLFLKETLFVPVKNGRVGVDFGECVLSIVDYVLSYLQIKWI